MQIERSGTRGATVLYEEFDWLGGGAAQQSLARGTVVVPAASAIEFFGSNGGGGAAITARQNGLTVRQITSAVAQSGQLSQQKHFPLRRRAAVAPIVPGPYRRYYRHTVEGTAWRDSLTAVVQMEVGLTGGDQQLPAEAFLAPKFVFRSVLAEAGGNWQTSFRLIAAGAATKADTGVSPLTPARMKWVFETGPIPQLRMYINDILKLTAQDGTAIQLPNGLADNLTPSAGRFSPAWGMDSAVGDLGNLCDAYYKVEQL